MSSQRAKPHLIEIIFIFIRLNQKMKLTILIEDLLDIELLDNEYIAHQCNASHNRAYGLASGIFKKYPKANIYSGKNKTNNRELGDIIIRDKIINIIGQKHR
jgi:hypothetical protein